MSNSGNGLHFAYNAGMSVFDKPPNRDKQFKLMLTAEERQELDDAATEFKMTASDLVREAVNQYVKKKRRKRKKK